MAVAVATVGVTTDAGVLGIADNFAVRSRTRIRPGGGKDTPYAGG